MKYTMFRNASQSQTAHIDRQSRHTLEKLQQSVSAVQRDMVTKQPPVPFENVQRACSTIYAQSNGQVSTGSGVFITLGNDLHKGFFLTAAHCVLRSTSRDWVDAAYVTDPRNHEWVPIQTSKIYIDGTADIALIETNIDLRKHAHYCLTLASVDSRIGDTCYVCGNPGGLDNDSLTMGIVRDPHFALVSSVFMADAIHISAPGIGGNSGSPILNERGHIVGLFTFGYSNAGETFNGGPSHSVLRHVLPTLALGQDARAIKKYLGLNWTAPNAFALKSYYTTTSFPNQGMVVQTVDGTHSPFKNVLQSGDLLLSLSNSNTKKHIAFGILPHQRTPAVFLYEPGNTVTITFIRGTTKHSVSDVVFQTTYTDVPDRADLPLKGGTV
mgnify:CR=1 FL=1